MANTHSLDLESSSSQYAYITDANQTGLDLSGDFTIEFWTKLESVPGTGRYSFVAKADGGNGQTSYEVYHNLSTSTLTLFISDDGNGGANTDDGVSWSPAAGVWYHVAVAYNTSATEAYFYVNGQLLGTKTSFDQTSIYNGTKDFNIGCTFGNVTTRSNFVDGLLDDVRVWSDIRTQAEIVNNAGKELVGDEANLVGYWKFNNDYTDLTSNNNDLTSSGSPTFTTAVAFTEATQISGSTYLETNLVSYWTMDEVSGTRADSHGSNELSDNNTVGSATGKIQLGADFERDNSEYLSIADASQTGLDFTGDMSISCWINLESLPSTNQTRDFIAKYNTTGNNRSYIYRFQDVGGTKMFEVRNSTDGTGANTSIATLNYSDFSVGTFYHLVFAYSATSGTCAVYVNGSSVGTITGLKTSIYNGSAIFEVGSNGEATATYDGIIDEVAIYSRTLHYGDVLDLYNAGNGIPYESAAATNTSGTLMMMGLGI